MIPTSKWAKRKRVPKSKLFLYGIDLRFSTIVDISIRLDDQIWGSDEEEEPNEEDMKDDENGKGSNEDTDAHNDLDADKNDENQQGDNKEDGLDAADGKWKLDFLVEFQTIIVFCVV